MVRFVRDMLPVFFLLLAAVAVVAPRAASAVEVERVESPGGIVAWLVRDSMVPLLSIEFSFRGGAALDPAGKAGLADMTTSLLDEGAGDMDSQAFQQKLSDLAVSISFGTGMDTIRGSLKTLNRTRDEAIDLLALSLTKPRFDEDAVERIRQQILAVLTRQSTDPNKIAGRVWWKAVFPDHPYGIPSGGMVETIAAISTDDMRRLISERFARDQLIVGVVGDITPEALGPLLDRAFGGLPAKGKPFNLDEPKPQAAGQIFVVERDVPQSVVLFGHGGIRRADPDWYAAYTMNYILGGGGFASRLYEEVREKRGLAYSVYSYMTPLSVAGIYSGGVSTANARVGESIDVIRAEWARMSNEGASEEELKDAKTYLTGSFPLSFTSTNSIARTLVGMQYNDLGIRYIAERNAFIEAVTLEAVRRVAKRLLKPEELTIVVVGKPEGVKPTAKAPRIGG